MILNTGHIFNMQSFLFKTRTYNHVTNIHGISKLAYGNN